MSKVGPMSCYRSRGNVGVSSCVNPIAKKDRYYTSSSKFLLGFERVLFVACMEDPSACGILYREIT